MQNLELVFYLVAIFGATEVLLSFARRAGKSIWPVLILLFCGLMGAVVWFPPDCDLQLLKK